jgi:DNA processing protein
VTGGASVTGAAASEVPGGVASDLPGEAASVVPAGMARGVTSAEPGGAADEVLRARAYLSRVAEPPAAALIGFVDAVGPVAAAARVRAGDVPDAVAGETSARRCVDSVDADLTAARAVGSRLLVPEDPAWPQWAFASFALAGSSALAPPVALWVRGPLAAESATERSVAVVGSRAATGYGMHVAGEFGAELAAAGATVVSGAAIGVDGSAHRGALAADGPTIAVLACGIDRAYPAAHATLLDRIGACGLVVSEYPPGSIPARHRFLVRNRLIAAFGGGTLVVEAGVRSGAQRTAADALALGKPLMAVPGPITSGLSAGCHRLIREGGALLVTRPEEVLEVVGRLGVDLAVERVAPALPTDGLRRAVALVHDALPVCGARDVRWLSRESGVPADDVRAALSDLERRGLARFRDGQWRLADPGVGRA